MNKFLGLLGLLFCTLTLSQTEEPAPTETPTEATASEVSDSVAPEQAVATGGQSQHQFDFKSGTITIGSDLATISLTDEYRYLNPEESKVFLEKVWGNPDGSGTLGMIFPFSKEKGVYDSWAVVITYNNDGHVADDDAASINYNDLLKQMKEATAASNEERVKQGYSKIELLGWAQPPRYDQTAKKLYWAKRLKFDKNDYESLNYNIRILGRVGVLNLNIVSEMNQLEFINNKAPEVLNIVDFNQGKRYADYNSSIDQLATYGIGGLIAGSIASKAGFFKVLLGALIAAKKLVIVVVIAVGAWIKKMFSGKTT